MSSAQRRKEVEMSLLVHVTKFSRGYDVLLLILVAIVAWGIYAWIQQFQQGMIVTGMRDQVFWGVNTATFLFFIRASLAGTVISVMPRLLGYTWQTPVSRIAEIITVSALLVAVALRVADIGRPDRLVNMLLYQHFNSPLTWEVFVVTLYLVGSLLYLYLRLIPDLALCRDRLGNSVSSTRQKIYGKLSLGWQNTPAQKKRLKKLVHVMGIALILVASSVQYVTAWIYTFTFRSGWSTAILAPYFVIIGFMSSVAMVIIIMTVFRQIFHFEEYMELEVQYYKLGWLLFVLIAVSAFFTFSELLPGVYNQGQDKELLNHIFTGLQSSPFWSSVVGSITIPALLLCWPKTRTVAGLTAASILTSIGVWIYKSYLFVVATLQIPLIPGYGIADYNPTWVEWSITFAGIAGFLLIIGLFFRFFPVIAIFEVSDSCQETPSYKITSAAPNTARQF